MGSVNPPPPASSLAANKQRVLALRERARALFDGGAPGVAVAIFLAEHTDQVVVALFEEVLASFPAEIQEKVRAGKVDLGFSRDMVSMALGKPQRVYTRRTATGQIEVWAYSGYETHMDRQRVDGHVRVRDAGGAYRTVYDSFWVDVEQRVEYDRLRVEFTGDAVSAVENVTR